MIENVPLLPLDTWRERIGFNPWHFWGLSGTSAPITSACNTLVKEFSWQNANAVGRVDIRRAIQKAEDRIRPLMNYAPAPHYNEVLVQWPRYPQENLRRLGYAGADARWITINLPEGYVQALGVEKRDLVTAGVSVVYSDLDGDGLKESFTVTVADPGTIIENKEVSLYFQTADRFGDTNLSERWRIRPVRVDKVGANFVISGYSWLMVDPKKYQGYSTAELDAALATNYVTKVDVYRRYTYSGITEADVQAVLIWETPPYPIFGETSLPYSTFDPSGMATAYARCTIRDKVNGVVGRGESVYDPVTAQWYGVPWYSTIYRFRPPDRVKIRYLAGYDTDQNGEPMTDMANIVTNLSAAALSRPICACEASNRELYNLQFDLARSSGANDESYGYISREDLNNPLGTRRGEVLAFKDIKVRRNLTGFVP